MPARGGAANVARTNRLAIKQLAERIRADLASQRSSDQTTGSGNGLRVVYILGEPALYFQLCAAGEALVRPVQAIVTTPAAVDGRPIATFLVIGPHAEREPALHSSWVTASKRLTLVGTYRFKPSSIMWLDFHDPRAPIDGAQQAQAELSFTRSNSNGRYFS